MSLLDLGREIGQEVSQAVDSAFLTAEEAQAVVEGAIGDVELGSAKIGGKGGLVDSLLSNLGLPEGLETVSLEDVEDFLDDLMEKGKEFLNSVDSKFGDLDATESGASTVEVGSDTDQFINSMRQALAAQLEERQAERAPVKNSGPSI